MADVGDKSTEYRAIVMRTFASEDERYQFYNKYALEKGFSVRRSYVEWDGANKKIVSTLVAYLNALTGEGVHVGDH
jgi:zinc finger SWIM domain-containing protein 3